MAKKHSPPVPQMGRLKRVREVVEEYFAQAKYSDEALRIRTLSWNKFLKDFGGRTLESCTPGDLVLWIHRHPAWKSSWTQRGVARWINRPFNWAAGLKLISANPFRGASFDEGEPRRPMTDAEFWGLFKQAGDHLFRRVLLFLRWTGCRPGEMARATWADVDWNLSVIVLQEHKSRQKTRKPRMIPLSDRCVKLLAWMRRQSDDDGLIFRNRRGHRWSAQVLNMRMKILRYRLGLPKDCVLYNCRHAFGTNGVLRGVHLTLLSKAMGHTSAATTERYYVHVDREIDAIRAATDQAGQCEPVPTWPPRKPS